MSKQTQIILAFLTVCLAWGCSYFFIRVGLRWMPPLLMGGFRYGIAGTLIWIWCEAKGDPRPSARQWRVSAILGVLFVVIGNGTILWAEKTVPSGVTALLVSVTPLGTLIFEWMFGQRKAPGLLTWVGLALGLAGIGILVGFPSGTIPILGVSVVLLGTLGWSLGSALSIKMDRLESPLRAIAAQMLIGSVVLFLLGGLSGEGRHFSIQNVSGASIFALVYLIFVASIAAYIAYGYLMYNVSPTAAGVCSFINPVVAMFMGALFGESMGLKEIAALAVVLVGVGLISNQELRRSQSVKNDPILEPSLTPAAPRSPNGHALKSRLISEEKELEPITVS